MIQSYRDLLAWQKAMDLVEIAYRMSLKLPKEEKFALSDQIRRAAVSIPSNFAEGQVRNSTKEFVQFLSIAKGSNAELYTQLLICVRLGYLTPDDTQQALSLSEEVSKMLSALIHRLTTDH